MMLRYILIFSSVISIFGCSVPLVRSPSTVTPSDIINTAQSFIGTPYQYGGTTPAGFDCAGFVMYVFNSHKISLPRTTSRLSRIGKKIPKSNLMPGDILFFHTRGIFPWPTHAGIYMGADQFIHATLSGVHISMLSNPYYQQRFLFARRP